MKSHILDIGWLKISLLEQSNSHVDLGLHIGGYQALGATPMLDICRANDSDDLVASPHGCASSLDNKTCCGFCGDVAATLLKTADHLSRKLMYPSATSVKVTQRKLTEVIF